MPRVADEFQTIHSEGGLLPPDLLRQLGAPKGGVPGTAPEDYGLPKGDRLADAITQKWNVLRRHWAEFRADAQKLLSGDAGTGLTNDKWTLPLLRALDFGGLPTTAGPEVDGRTYAINRMFGSVPIHLIGCGLSLDRRTAGARGAALVNPHGLVQEFLNRRAVSLWGIVSNGLRLRILRDSQALSRQSYLEFDLEAMFAGEIYPDFVVLWLTAHASRFQEREAGKPDTCWLEDWTKVAAQDGTRILGDLRQGVEKALATLGQGFVGHPRNGELREALRSGILPPPEFHAQLLRVVYRLIFLFVAEDRVVEGTPLLHLRDESAEAQEARLRYASHYSTRRLRRMAADIRGSRHGDLWQQHKLMVCALSGDEPFEAVRRHLALPAFGSFLWSPLNTASVNNCELSNADLLGAVRQLAFTRQDRALRPVDYRNLGAEELGGVYESLLALTPQIGPDGTSFSFAELAGNERKTSGSYYTPDSLVQCLLDSALEPVIEDALKGKVGAEAEKALLSLRVCDPSVGSGHFLVGAAHRLARHLARVRALAVGESEPSPLLYQHALRDVIGRCLYGVDLNPMAAELCRVSLWLEALDPGKPLSFLDHHIRVGNSLIGTTPGLIAGGIPDDAYRPIEGDDDKACGVLRKRNRGERSAQTPLFAEEAEQMESRLRQAAATLEQLPDERPEDVRAKELAFRRHEETTDYRQRKQLADAWCAAFVIQRRFREQGRNASVIGITQRDLNALVALQHIPEDLSNEIQNLAGRYQFFHWHLAFPEVFERGGFNCVLGNPPWDQLQFREQEFFERKAPELSRAPTEAIRKRLIASLADTAPELLQEYRDELRKNEGDRLFALESGRFPKGARGRVNSYLLFVELASQVSPSFVGLIVPTGVATDESGRLLFAHLFGSGRIRRLWDFENRERLFSDVHSAARYAVFVIGPPTREPVDFCFGLGVVEEASESARHFHLTADDLGKINPNTLTCPSFRSSRDAELVKAIHRRWPVLVNERAEPHVGESWGIATKPGLFNMATDSSLFIQEASLGPLLPVYEGKMFTFFDHRFADVVISATAQRRQGQSDELSTEQHADPSRVAKPRHWVLAREVSSRVEGEWDRQWIPGWKEITSPTNARTLIPAILPLAGIGHKIPVFLPDPPSRHLSFALTANLASFVTDFVCRNKLNGTSLTPFTFKQLPVLQPLHYQRGAPWELPISLSDWLRTRVLELTYTAWDLSAFAKDCGWSGPPFRWDEERRSLLRCELDAAFFSLYLSAELGGAWSRCTSETDEEFAALRDSFRTPRSAVEYVMDTFQSVRRRDEERFKGEYRTKRVILEIYDAMAEAVRTGRTYRTRLDPAPGDRSCCHSPNSEAEAR